GRVIGRAEIAEHVWDEEFDPFSNLIEVYMNRLRRKLDAGAATPLLHTRRGAGYVLSANSDTTDTAREGTHREAELSAYSTDALVHGRDDSSVGSAGLRDIC